MVSVVSSIASVVRITCGWISEILYAIFKN